MVHVNMKTNDKVNNQTNNGIKRVTIYVFIHQIEIKNKLMVYQNRKNAFDKKTNKTIDSTKILNERKNLIFHIKKEM